MRAFVDYMSGVFGLEYIQKLPALPELRRLEQSRIGLVRGIVAKESGLVEQIRRAADHGRLDQLERVIDDAADEALARLRSARSPEEGLREKISERLDALLRSNDPELLEHDFMPAALKQMTMRALDWVNQAVGAYPRWTSEVSLALSERRGAHVYELAAGTGGFASYLAGHLSRASCARVTASDRDAQGLSSSQWRPTNPRLRFERRDATDLGGLRGVDLFVCTQSAHHLKPGALVRLIAGAMAVSSQGLLVIDLVRAPSVAIGVGALLSLVAPLPPLVIDGVTSVRRAYSRSELALLAQLAGASAFRLGAVGPAHCSLYVRGA